MVPMQRARRAQAAVLTAIAVAIVAAIGATLGTVALVFAIFCLPVPLAVLWLASDVLRADEWREQTAAPQPVVRARKPSVRETAETAETAA